MVAFKEAVIVGGFGQSRDALWGLANEISSGEHAFASDVDIVTLAEGMDGAKELGKPAESRIVLAISAGTKLVEQAGVFVSLNGAEPTPYRRSISAALFHGEKLSENDGHTKPNLSDNDPVFEIVRNPGTIRALRWAKHFSTVQHMIRGGQEAFPSGRAYLPTFDDEFGFGSNGEVEIAQSNGIAAMHLPGTHGEAVLRPRNHTGYIKQVLETMNL